MKLSTMIIMLLCISVCIGLFDQTGSVTPEYGEITFNDVEYNASVTEQNATGTVAKSNEVTNAMWRWILNPTDWRNAEGFIYIIIGLFAASLVGLALYAALSNSFAPDTYFFGVMYIGILAMGFLPIHQLYSFLSRELTSYICQGLEYCYLSTVITVLVVSPLAVTWVFSVLQAWRTATQ